MLSGRCQRAPSESLLAPPHAEAKRFRSGARQLSKPSTGECSGQHHSPLGFYSCVSGLVSHATALQLSDNPCSKETKHISVFSRDEEPWRNMVAPSQSLHRRDQELDDLFLLYINFTQVFPLLV